MQDNKAIRTLKDVISEEPDIVRRCALIEFNMDILEDPENALLTHNIPDGYYVKWAETHFKSLVNRVAEKTGADPAQIADKDKRTPEQQQALYEAAAQEQMIRIEAALRSNYYAAIKHINEYCIAQADAGGDDLYKPLRDEKEPNVTAGQLVNVPLAATLYFFATHEDINPLSKDTLTAKNKSAIIKDFNSLDAFYREHREEINTEQELLQSYIAEINPSKAQQTYERLNTLAVVPQSYIVPNHKLVNSLTRATRYFEPENELKIILEVSKRDAKKKVESICLLSYEGENVKIIGRQPFTEFDRNVYNAVVSLYYAGNIIITVAMVWRTMTGKTDTEKPTQGQAAAVKESLDKMRFMRVQINCSEEFKMRNLKIDDEAVTSANYDDNLLHLSVVKIKAAKTVIEAYKILTAPVLYQYSAAVKQLITIPLDLLDIKKVDARGKLTTHSVEYTERRSIITNYLIRRIIGMKGNNNLDNHCITFADYEKNGQIHEGLYTVAGCPELSQPMPKGLTDAEKQKRKNDARYIRDDAKLSLDNWKAKGAIKDYKDYKKGKIIAGFEIVL